MGKKLENGMNIKQEKNKSVNKIKIKNEKVIKKVEMNNKSYV